MNITSPTQTHPLLIRKIKFSEDVSFEKTDGVFTLIPKGVHTLTKGEHPGCATVRAGNTTLQIPTLILDSWSDQKKATLI